MPRRRQHPALALLRGRVLRVELHPAPTKSAVKRQFSEFRATHFSQGTSFPNKSYILMRVVRSRGRVPTVNFECHPRTEITQIRFLIGLNI